MYMREYQVTFRGYPIKLIAYFLFKKKKTLQAIRERREIIQVLKRPTNTKQYTQQTSYLYMKMKKRPPKTNRNSKHLPPPIQS